MVRLEINLTSDEAQRLEARARANGYSTSNEYVRSVIETLLKSDDDSDAEIFVDLKDSWRKMQRGGSKCWGKSTPTS